LLRYVRCKAPCYDLPMNRWLPLIALLVVLAVIAAVVVPPIYRGMLFTRDCRGLITAAKAGDIKQMAAACDPGQQQRVENLFTDLLPADFKDYIKTLKLTSWERQQDGTVLAVLTLRTEYNGAAGVYQGRLLWVYDGVARRWHWDFNRTEAAEFSLSGEPDWQPLATMLELARRYR